MTKLARAEGWAKGATPENWCCVDCGTNTAPGYPTRIEMERFFAANTLRSEEADLQITIDEQCEVYRVKPSVWMAAGMKPFDGCLCIGCLEKRLGRRLRPKDFDRKHPFHNLPGTPRLLNRRGDDGEPR
jgi:hypothetical protein